MASFNGLDLGLVFACNTTPNPTGRQVNTYAGAVGLEVLNHGGRGGSTALEGGFVAASDAGLSAIEGAFLALQQDAGGYVLVDTRDRAWSPVILVNFGFVGAARPVVGGGYAQRYRAEFLHVT